MKQAEKLKVTGYVTNDDVSVQTRHRFPKVLRADRQYRPLPLVQTGHVSGLAEGDSEALEKLYALELSCSACPTGYFARLRTDVT